MSDVRDEILEAAAAEIESPQLTDLAGALAKTKRGREHYELRTKAISETRKRCAEIIRAMKSGRGLDPVEQLRRISEISNPRQYDLYLIEAWPLAWRGWLNIFCTIKCNSNSVPPETEYRMELTSAGQAILAAVDQSSGREPSTIRSKP